METELGDEPFLREGQFLNGCEVGIPIDEIDFDRVPLVVGDVPFKDIFGASRLAQVCGVVAGNSGVVDLQFHHAGSEEVADALRLRDVEPFRGQGVR